MKQIISTNFRYSHNDEHDQLHNNLSAGIAAETPVKLGIVKENETYQQARQTLIVALQAELGSQHTKTIEDSDWFRDDTDLGFSMFVESHLHHPDPAIQENARRIMRIIDQYGNIRKLNYNAESSNMTNRNTEITSKYATELTSLGNGWGTAWLNALTEANNQFVAHFGERADEQVTKITANTLEARAAVDDAWQAIVTRINALAVVNGEADYATFIDKANYYIDYNKTLVTARKAKKGGSTDSAEPAK
jgi:Family of unknown function (DUF6261)